MGFSMRMGGGGYEAGAAEVFDCRVEKRNRCVCVCVYCSTSIRLYTLFYSPDKINWLKAEFTMDLN